MVKKKVPKKAKKTPKKAVKKKKVIRRGKSKLTLIKDPDAPKTKMKAFRCDENLDAFLESLPKGEQSSFVVEAIYRLIAEKKQVTCPTCNGHGKLGPNVTVLKA